MPPGATRKTATGGFPHPDDQQDVQAAMHDAENGKLLSAEASESFVRWLEGDSDESWRDESEPSA